jgi:CBS domain containing-hemolysin-like protein
MNDLLGVLLVLVLVLVNGFFVAAEFSLVKVRAARVSELAAAGSRRAEATQRLVRDLDSYLSAIQFGITTASLGLGWVGAPALAPLLRPPLEFVGLTSTTALRATSAVIAFALIAFLHFAVGERAPKSLAIRRADSMSLWVTAPLRLFYILFLPLVWIFDQGAQALLRLLRIEPASEAELAHSEEELRMIIMASQEGGHIDEVEETIMRRALTFGERSVTDIMVPRTEMAALPADLTIRKALEEVTESNHTRYPVYEDDLDDTIGYVHVKEIYRASPERAVRTLLRPIGFISETASIEVALQRFQSTRTPLAIVVDEHGGTAGIVTIQDVVEELIGEVQDEFDRESPLVEEHPQGGFSVDGSARITDLEEILGFEFPDEGYPTLGGRVFEQLQRRPRVGDECNVGSFRGRILEVDGMRITRVLLVPLEPEAEAKAGPEAQARNSNGGRGRSLNGTVSRLLRAEGGDDEADSETSQRNRPGSEHHKTID